MANYWVRVDNNEVVECLNYLPERDGDWRLAVEVPANPIPNRQVQEGHTFDLTKNPVEIVYGVKDLSVDDRKETLLQQITLNERIAIQEEAAKELHCHCDSSSECCIQTLTQSIISLRVKRQQINLLNTHEQIDEYITANNLL